MSDEQNCRQAFDDFYHKIKAEVSYDHWCSIWRFISKRQARGVKAGDGRMPDSMRDFITGMAVSVDVSTCEDDEGHRYFGTVTEVMDASEKHGVILLVQDAEPNFERE